VLLCTLFGFYQELYLAVFDPLATPTFFGMRHSSTLGLVPMWYYTFLLIFPRRVSPTLIAGALLQLAILILAWRIRASVTWMFMFLFLLTSVLAAIRFRSARMDGRWSWAAAIRSWPMLLGDALRWPAMLLLFGILANGVYNQQSRHLIYSTDDVIPHHGLWWAGVTAFHRWKPEVFGVRVKNTEGTPEGWWHVRDYLDRTRLVPWNGTYDMADYPVPGVSSPWTGGLKYRLVDESLKRIYVEAVTNEPLVSARFYLIQQPKNITRQIAFAYRNAKNSTWIWLTLLSSAGIFAFALLLEDKKVSAPPDMIISLSAGAFLMAWLPGLWAWATGPYLPDAILLSACFLSLALGLGAYRLFRYGRQAWA
jgi:hypothetical protein